MSLCVLRGESNYFANIIHARSAMSVFVRRCPHLSKFVFICPQNTKNSAVMAW